jgi:MinD superfamily P-loop ATPase
MIIAVASGKGGTGKTTVAVNLALSVDSANPLFLDCDVEEPNAALFLHPTLDNQEKVGILIPQVDEAKCTACGRCAEVCQFNAIAVVGQKVLIFPELCHGCGSCTLNCPEDAITEELNVTGVLESGPAGPIRFWQGVMNVGQAMATPIIHQLKERALDGLPPDGLAIIDVSPGAACPVVEAVHGADFCLMVTEPTPFGLHDLRIVVEVIRDELYIPVGVVVNRDGVGDTGVDEYCATEGVPILMRIPLDRRIAEAYSEGVPLVEALPKYREKFAALYGRIRQEVAK